GVQLSAAEMRRVAKRGTRIVHCPSANLKLASGIVDLVALRRAGVVVGIGADGAPCNNRLDAVGELRLASLLAKVKRHDARAMTPLEALELLTIEGARCLGLEAEIGSLEVGKRADVVVVSLRGIHQAPAQDPLSALVYASTAQDVRHVVADGHTRVRNGQLLGVDLARLRAQAAIAVRRVARRAGLTR